jgi:hypothetical protein
VLLRPARALAGLARGERVVRSSPSRGGRLGALRAHTSNPTFTPMPQTAPQKGRSHHRGKAADSECPVLTACKFESPQLVPDAGMGFCRVSPDQPAIIAEELGGSASRPTPLPCAAAALASQKSSACCWRPPPAAAAAGGRPAAGTVQYSAPSSWVAAALVVTGWYPPGALGSAVFETSNSHRDVYIYMYTYISSRCHQGVTQRQQAPLTSCA